MNINKYFEYKLSHLWAGFGILIGAGLIWGIVKLFQKILFVFFYK